MKVVSALILILLFHPWMADASSNPIRDPELNFSSYMQLAKNTADVKSRVSAGQAANIVKSQYGGKILSVKTVKKGGSSHFRVKVLLKSGVVKVVTVDGSSGSIY